MKGRVAQELAQRGRDSKVVGELCRRLNVEYAAWAATEAATERWEGRLSVLAMALAIGSIGVFVPLLVGEHEQVGLARWAASGALFATGLMVGFRVAATLLDRVRLVHSRERHRLIVAAEEPLMLGWMEDKACPAQTQAPAASSTEEPR